MHIYNKTCRLQITLYLYSIIIQQEQKHYPIMFPLSFLICIRFERILLNGSTLTIMKRNDHIKPLTYKYKLVNNLYNQKIKLWLHYGRRWRQ